MAKYNEILVGRFNRAIQKWSGVKGTVPSPQMSGELMPSFLIFRGVEDLIFESIENFAQAVNIAAVAANTSEARLRNPTTSGVVAVVESFLFSTFAADSPVITYGPSTTDFANVMALSQNALDGRGRPTPSLKMSWQDSTPGQNNLASSIFQYQISAIGNFQVIAHDAMLIPILPGFAIQIASGVVNQALNVSWMWRERALEDSEKT